MPQVSRMGLLGRSQQLLQGARQDWQVSACRVQGGVRQGLGWDFGTEDAITYAWSRAACCWSWLEACTAADPS